MKIKLGKLKTDKMCHVPRIWWDNNNKTNQKAINLMSQLKCRVLQNLGYNLVVFIIYNCIVYYLIDFYIILFRKRYLCLFHENAKF